MKSFVIHVKLKSSKEFELLKLFLERVSAAFNIKEIKTPKDEPKSTPTIDSVFGSWDSDETAQEMVKFIYESRSDKFREFEL